MIKLMLPGGSRVACMIYDMFPDVDLLKYTDPAQACTTQIFQNISHLVTIGWDQNYLLQIVICPTL